VKVLKIEAFYAKKRRSDKHEIGGVVAPIDGSMWVSFYEARRKRRAHGKEWTGREIR
jgi:hypothetical protein